MRSASARVIATGLALLAAACGGAAPEGAPGPERTPDGSAPSRTAEGGERGDGAPSPTPSPTPSPDGEEAGEGARRDERSAGTRGSEGVAWTRAAVLRRLDGRRVRVEGRRVRLDASTLTCGGMGRAVRRRGAPAWTRFRCVQPTFPTGQVAGPDAVLEIVPTGRRAFRVAARDLTEY